MADTTTIAFLRIDLQGEQDGEIPQSVRVHTGLGTLYPRTSQWSDYQGVGAILSLAEVVNDTSTAAAEFSVGLAIPAKGIQRYAVANFFDRVRNTSLENREVLMHAVDIPAGASALPEPQLVLLGEVANIEISPTRLSMRVYTAATLLSQVVGGASRYSDITHKRFNDSTDEVMRFQTDTTLRETYFP